MIAAKEATRYFEKEFATPASYVFFSHGRLELLGNHTDHNHGLCLVSSVDLGVTAAVNKREDGIIRVSSEGYRPFTFEIGQKRKAPASTTVSLIQGIAELMQEAGYKVGGFDCAMKSDIPSGSGISSSACVESLFVKILSYLYNEDKVPPLEMAKLGQRAENEYFGKPSGLLDQVGTSYGGVAFLDFLDPKNPTISPVEFALPLDVILVSTPSSHAGLNDLYAAIPQDMYSVAKALGGTTLRDIKKQEFLAQVGNPNLQVSEIAKLRATHYYDENDRVIQGYEAVKGGNTLAFLQAVKGSAFSMQHYLFNTMIPGQYRNSPQEAVDFASPYLPNGACRVMGGGFAGSILCFSKPEETPGFLAHMKKGYGEKAVHQVRILPDGPTVLDVRE